MADRSPRPVWHVIFWIVVVMILTLIFGYSWGNKMHAFYFTVSLLPVIMGTSYFFNYFLVPRFLLAKKYFKFGLYFFYTLVVSLYLELMVLMLAFIFLAKFDYGQIGPNASGTFTLGIILYVIVFIGSFALMVKQLTENNSELQKLKEDKAKRETAFLEVMSNRKLTRINLDDILYIESLSDFVKIHGKNGEKIDSKEKISSLEERLPDNFLRIHRSFLINTESIDRMTNNEIEIGSTALNIGRSYKKNVLEHLKQENQPLSDGV
ncbi:LytR/AlgR family response regulator transcription factor [Saccharicrinis sp. FJH54]|uniref:LytR/AlgR family response regulator transcription factor n=1 Tax=Saccharicrinis sp. FJH54 TaxID=3344665 RepID=UPI0035D3F786